MEKKSKNILYKKLLKVMGEVGKVQKSGWNDFQKYQYVTEADLIEVTRKSLIENGIFVATSVKDMKKEEDITSVILEHTLTCVDTGEEIIVNSAGQGQDKGDKGIFKAKTGAMKYFLSKCFMIASEDDPENEKAAKSKGFNKSNTTSKPVSKPVAAKPIQKTNTPIKTTTKLVAGQVLKTQEVKANF